MEAVNIFDLLEKVDKGQIVIPDFQRPFIWETKQVEELLNSVANGFFIGSILMLEDYPNNRFSPKPVLGVEDVSYPTDTTIKYILDGQQRVSSLYYAFYEPSVSLGNQGIKRFFFSHQNNEVISAPDPKYLMRRLGANRQQIRQFIEMLTGLDIQDLPVMSVFLTEENYYKFIDSHPQIAEDFKRQLRNTFEKIKNFTIPVITLPYSTSDDDIVNIFERINRTGTPLDTFDLAVARYYPIGIRLNDLRQQIKGKDFIKPIKDVGVLKVMAIVNNKDPKAQTLLKLTDRNENVIEQKITFENSWSKATRLLELAYQRLTNTYGAKKVHGRKHPFIPYSSLLIPIAAMIKTVEESTSIEDSWKKVDAWYWYSVFSQRYTSAVESKSYSDWQKISQWITNDEMKPAFPLFSEKQLKGAMNDASPTAALAKAFYCWLMMRQVLDLKTGQLLQHYSECVVDHIFPKSRYGNVANSIFNFTLLDRSTNSEKGNKEPSEFINSISSPSHRHDVNRINRTFSSHYIDENAYECLTVNDIEGFINARATCFIRFLFDRQLKYIVPEAVEN
jgi:hypothetical protein